MLTIVNLLIKKYKQLAFNIYKLYNSLNNQKKIINKYIFLIK